MANSLHARLQAAVSERIAITNLVNPWKTKADLFSNDYLSLSCNPRLRSDVLKRLDREPEFLGAYGSRFLDGNTKCHVALETRFLNYYNAPAALIFNSGYDANVALFGTVPKRGDLLIFDELVHASVIDGMRSSRASRAMHPFKHNSPESLRSILQGLVKSTPGIKDGSSTIFVAFETVYSMDGDIAPVAALVEVVEQVLPRGSAHIMVDEAHSTGLYGRGGRGLISHLGLENRIALRLHTFGKAMSSTGAVLLCAPVIRTYLINHSRPFMFTTALSRINIFATESILDMIESEVGDQLRERLFQLCRYTRDLLEQELSSIPSSTVRLVPLTSGDMVSPIIPICTPHALWLSCELRRQGWAVIPITYPGVAKGDERIRMIVHAANTEEEIAGFVRAMADCLRGDRERSVRHGLVMDGLTADELTSDVRATAMAKL